MTAENRKDLIEILCFKTGKEAWWFENMTNEALVEMYDQLSKIY